MQSARDLVRGLLSLLAMNPSCGQSQHKSTENPPNEAALPRERPQEILRFQAGHQIEIFDSGQEAFESMFRAIANASDHIHLETYILRTDRLGRRLLEAVAERSRAGVAVRVVFDAVGSRGLDRQLLARLGREGVEFEEFNPPSQWIWRFRPRQRDHRKMLLVDGEIGFLGGLNIGDEYVEEDSEGPTWRDAHLRIEGAALTELEALFVENWFRSGGTSFEWRPLVAVEPKREGEHSIAILADGPSYRRRRLRRFFIDELRRAEKNVLIVSPYFAPGPRVLEALSSASERGVQINLLLAGQTDHQILRRASHVIAPHLMRRGVRVYEDTRRMMHAKLAAFDDRVAVVGTSNLDRQSLNHSCEVNAVFEGPAIPAWINEHFGPQIPGVKALDPATLSHRSPLSFLRDRWATFWSEF